MKSNKRCLTKIKRRFHTLYEFDCCYSIVRELTKDEINEALRECLKQRQYAFYRARIRILIYVLRDKRNRLF